MIGWFADLRESMISRPNYYGCPRLLTFIHLGASVVIGVFFTVPGTYVPLIVITIPCSMGIHLWAAWLTYSHHPLFFTIMWRRFRYLCLGKKIGRFHV